MKRLEALADTIAMLNDYWNPESRAYQLRNPGMLTARDSGPHEDGTRIFYTHKGGYAALLDRLQKRAAVHPSERFFDTLAAFGFRDEFQISDALSFIRKCIDPAPHKDTALAFFIVEDTCLTLSK